MGDYPRFERVELTAAGPDVGPVTAGAVATVAGVATLVLAGELTGWNLTHPGTALQVSAAVVLVTAATVGVTNMLRNIGRVVEFRDDAFCVVSLDRLGRESDVRRVGYDEVDLAVRAGLTEEGGETTVSYVLVRSEGPPVTLDSVDDPQTVERVLRERVSAPDERARVVRDDGGRRTAIESNRSFWRDWPLDASIPSSPVVDRSALPEEKTDLVPDPTPNEAWIPRPTFADQMKTSGEDHWDTGATVPWEWE